MASIIDDKKIIIILLLVSFAFAGCGNSGEAPPPVAGPKTAKASSEKFASLEQKQQFLEQYVKFRRTYKELDFYIDYRNNGGGRVPGPSDWDICLAAVVPQDEIEQWIGGLAKIESPDKSWLEKIPAGIGRSGISEWYASDGIAVGIDRKNNTVVYRNTSS